MIAYSRPTGPEPRPPADDGWYVEPNPNDPGMWRIVRADGGVVPMLFGSAAAAVNWMDDPINGRIFWPAS